MFQVLIGGQEDFEHFLISEPEQITIEANPLPVPLHAIAEERGMSLLADIEASSKCRSAG